MIRGSVILFSIIVIAAFSSCKKEEPRAGITAQAVFGSAVLVSGAGERPLKAGDAVGMNDAVVTGEKSIVDLLYGASGLIRLGENSKLNVSELAGDKGDDTKLFMEKGKLHVTISKIKKGGFLVNTPTLVAAIRGTSFRIVVDEKKSRLDVLKGTVKMNPIVEGKVAEDLTTTVEMTQTVEVDEKIARAAVEEKKEIGVTALRPQEIQEIVDEVKDITEPVMEKLNDDVKKELKQDVMTLPQAAELEKASDEAAKAQQLEQQREAQLKQRRQKETENAQLRMKQEQDRLTALKKQEDEEKARQAQLKAQQEQQRKEKEKRDRASNIPTL